MNYKIPIEIVVALIGIIATLFGAWAGSAISRKTANDIRNKNEFNKAATTFRSAFTNEIRLIKESTLETNFTDIFSRAFVRHYNAVIRFMPYLSEADRTEIEKAWDNHCYPKGISKPDRAIYSANFIHYDHSQGIKVINEKPIISEEHEESFRKAKSLALENLDSILSFSKLK